MVIVCVYVCLGVCVCGDSLPCELLSEHHYWYSIIYLPVSATNVCIKYTSTDLLHAGCVFGHHYFPTVCYCPSLEAMLSLWQQDAEVTRQTD